MPTQNKITSLILTPEEHERFRREATESGFKSLSNYLRKRLRLPPLTVGAEKGNQRAVGNPGRWKKEI